MQRQVKSKVKSARRAVQIGPLQHWEKRFDVRLRQQGGGGGRYSEAGQVMQLCRFRCRAAEQGEMTTQQCKGCQSSAWLPFTVRVFVCGSLTRATSVPACPISKMGTHHQTYVRPDQENVILGKQKRQCTRIHGLHVPLESGSASFGENHTNIQSIGLSREPVVEACTLYITSLTLKRRPVREISLSAKYPARTTRKTDKNKVMNAETSRQRRRCM